MSELPDWTRFGVSMLLALGGGNFIQANPPLPTDGHRGAGLTGLTAIAQSKGPRIDQDDATGIGAEGAA